MTDSRQQAYLDAMDIGVWQLRETPSTDLPDAVTESGVGLKLGPGGGGILFVCAADSHSESRLANDIARALRSVPVWAWPDSDQTTTTLSEAVEENLFTTVAIFGEDLARQFYSGELPVSLGPANLVVLPAFEDIQRLPEAKRELWTTFCRTGMVKN